MRTINECSELETITSEIASITFQISCLTHKLKQLEAARKNIGKPPKQTAKKKPVKKKSLNRKTPEEQYLGVRRVRSIGPLF